MLLLGFQYAGTRKLMCSILFVDWFVVGFNRCLPRRRFRRGSIKMFSNGLRRKDLATKRASRLFCGLSVTLRFNWLIDPTGAGHGQRWVSSNINFHLEK